MAIYDPADDDRLEQGGRMKAKVETTIIQWIEVPAGTDKQDVFNFLAENQSFRDAFEGVSDAEQTMRITDVEVVFEEVLELGEEAYDD